MLAAIDLKIELEEEDMQIKVTLKRNIFLLFEEEYDTSMCLYKVYNVFILYSITNS